MGCVNSKKKLCQNCQAPVRRSYSMNVRRPSGKSDDSHHVVAFASSTLGSLRLDTLNRHHPFNQNHFIEDEIPFGNVGNNKEKVIKDEFKMEMIEAKTWSEMINEKIPKVFAKTPTRTPPGEPETINVWELMEGLEDSCPLRPPHHLRSFSFQVPRNPYLSCLDEQSTPRLKENGEASSTALRSDRTDNDSNLNSTSNGMSVHVPQNPILSHLDDQTMPRLKENDEAPSIPLWPDMSDNDSNSNSNSNDTSIVSEFDPEVISTFRKALEDLPPANPFHLKSLDSENQAVLTGKDQLLEVKNDEQKANGTFAGNRVNAARGTGKVIVYYTSLRGVRKTYEDCCHVRVILKGLGVKVDERDVSMHSGFKEELKELLGDGFRGGLPRVFVGQKYVGGAEEIRQMNEEGRLEKVVESCELVEDSGGGSGRIEVCEACGDIRFVPCETCCGSCKIYFERDFEEEYDESEHEYGFHRCPECNENGLVRCPMCCD
ncbi:uncharacterized protein At5g39865-like [Olea europaea var. sylvestris]|uniref:Uncharacterized protein At5g39865-like n=1 Tax=Olea europaea subsp. europaea TaxID=158383 RepID=A0A8S0SM15_OLEEU|nr:uncharacterized protein At5g39865-like [Olea europaea var. sylvestris]CAA2994014.1 uncharacterized protein At5g39865-like [Olea europaea subsp. europaea]